MCGAPHLRIHSSFRSAVFDSACQLRVSILFRLRPAAECPWGALCMRLVARPGPDFCPPHLCARLEHNV